MSDTENKLSVEGQSICEEETKPDVKATKQDNTEKVISEAIALDASSNEGGLDEDLTVHDDEETRPIFSGRIVTDPDNNLLPANTSLGFRFSNIDEGLEIESLNFQIRQLISVDGNKNWEIIQPWVPLESLNLISKFIGPSALQLDVKTPDGQIQNIWLGSYFFYDPNKAENVFDLIKLFSSAMPYFMRFEDEVKYISEHLFFTFAVIFDTIDVLGANGYYSYEEHKISARYKSISVEVDTESRLISFDGLPVLVKLDALHSYSDILKNAPETYRESGSKRLIPVAFCLAVRRAYKYTETSQSGLFSLAQKGAHCGIYSAILMGLLKHAGYNARAINYNGKGGNVHVFIEILDDDHSLILDPTTGVTLAGSFADVMAGLDPVQFLIDSRMSTGIDLISDLRESHTQTPVENLNYESLFPL